MIERARKEDSISIANLHKAIFRKGLLSNLGLPVIIPFYSYLISNELVIVYRENSCLCGFICFSRNSGGTMKKFLLANPSVAFKIVFKTIQNPALATKIYNHFISQRKLAHHNGGENIFDHPQMISFAVDHRYKGRGIGKKLLYHIENDILHEGVDQYSLLAGGNLDRANKFYSQRRRVCKYLFKENIGH